MDGPTKFDLICIGSGPAGKTAAIQAAKSGYRAAVVERESQVGGMCLLSGTIPSKALREQALRYRRMRLSASVLKVELGGGTPLSALLRGVDRVIAGQDQYLRAQLERNHVSLFRGLGALKSATCVEVRRLDGTRTELDAGRVLIASGSRPRHVASVEVDHERVLDSDSILSLPYVPGRMIVLGSGVIACEYASIFAALGCAVTIVDKAAEPLGFLDAALRRGFCAGLEAMGGRYLAGAEVEEARFDGISEVLVRLKDGSRLSSEIVLAAFGRVANLDGIGLDQLGLGLTARGHLQVDERFETTIAGVFAAGDAIGPPSLACAAADQGRRAALAAFNLDPPARVDLLPTGVYTIPEIACVGLSESDALREQAEIVVGRANFSEVARAHIAGEPTGFLRLLCERGSMRVLGAQAIGEGATELVHLGQLAIASQATAEYFVDHMFNFPTMTEAYRIAAFDCLRQAPAREAPASAQATDCESEHRRTHCT
jgi:NAD(P) transhydrogenase